MSDNFQHVKATKEQPAEEAFPVTFTAGVFDPPEDGRAIYVGGSGNLVVRLVGQPTVSRTFANVAAGTILPLRITQVIESGTTATNLLVLA